MLEVEGKEPLEKMTHYDKLGDLCCELRAFTAATKFYGKQVQGPYISSIQTTDCRYHVVQWDHIQYVRVYSGPINAFLEK